MNPISDRQLFFSDFQSGIFELPLQGGTLAGLIRAFGGYVNATALVVTDEQVHWTQLNLGNSILYRGVDERLPSHLLICGQQWPQGLWVERAQTSHRRIYWLNTYIYEGGGRIMALEDSSQPKLLLSLGHRPMI